MKELLKIDQETLQLLKEDLTNVQEKNILATEIQEKVKNLETLEVARSFC